MGFSMNVLLQYTEIPIGIPILIIGVATHLDHELHTLKKIFQSALNLDQVNPL